jgi:hypothetical protein
MLRSDGAVRLEPDGPPQELTMTFDSAVTVKFVEAGTSTVLLKLYATNVPDPDVLLVVDDKLYRTATRIYNPAHHRMVIEVHPVSGLGPEMATYIKLTDT